MRRRSFLKSTLAGATALAIPQIGRAEAQKTITFVPHADLASLDPVWTTADVTRNFALAVYDTLYGYDAEFNAQPQMVEGHAVENDGLQWDLLLRDGLKFHDGSPVRAPDCVATITRWAKRYPMGQALMDRTDEFAAISDKTICFRVKKPFPLLPEALAEPYCSIMPGRLAKTDTFEQIKEAVGSGPFKSSPPSGYPASAPPSRGTPTTSRVPAANRASAQVPRWRISSVSSGITCNTQRPRPQHWLRGEVDWWENPAIDLVPYLQRNNNLVITVKDCTRMGCLRFNQLFPPFEMRRCAVSCWMRLTRRR
jgi:peptide/nickel transport system substrate-binding protein